MIFLSTFFPQKAVPPSLVLNTRSGVGSSNLTALTEPLLEENIITTRAYNYPKCGNTWIYSGKSPFFATCTCWCGLKISVDKHRVDNLTGNGHGHGHDEGGTVDN